MLWLSDTLLSLPSGAPQIMDIILIMRFLGDCTLRAHKVYLIVFRRDRRIKRTVYTNSRPWKIFPIAKKNVLEVPFICKYHT